MKTINIFPSLFALLVVPFLAFAQTQEISDSSQSIMEIMDQSFKTVQKNNINKNLNLAQQLSNPESYYTELGKQLYAAYKMFKGNEIDSLKSSMKKNGFDELKVKSYNIEPSGRVDSLVFSKPDHSRAEFVMVDLGYLQNVTVSMVLMSEKSPLLLDTFENLIRHDGATANEAFCVPTICAEFISNGDYWIVDNRWENKTFTKFESLYHYLMSAYTDSFVINFSETVPEEWVTRKEANTYDFAVGR